MFPTLSSSLRTYRTHQEGRLRRAHLFPRSNLQNYEVEKLGFPHKTLDQGIWHLEAEVGADP
jgi:hypothetical protein